jgi:hypothetical protein
LDNWKRNLAREARPTIDLILIRNQSTFIEKGKPKNNNKIDRNCDVLPIEYAITIAFSMLIGKVAGYCQL